MGGVASRLMRRQEGTIPCANRVIRVNKLLHDGERSIPHNPLAQSCASNLYFTLEFMQAFGEKVFSGTTYAGISFESDRPELSPDQIPDGGLDIQDHPVCWTLPRGKCNCWSLRELKLMAPDQLASDGSDEAYLSMAVSYTHLTLPTNREV